MKDKIHAKHIIKSFEISFEFHGKGYTADVTYYHAPENELCQKAYRVSINKWDYHENYEGDVTINPQLINIDSKLINIVGDALHTFLLNNQLWIHR